MKLYILLIYNILRIILLKVCHPNNFRASLVQRISPLTSMKIFDSGKILLGRNLEISRFCDVQVHGNGNIEIGDRTYMNLYCMISCHGNVHIGNNCMFGPGVKIFDNNHRFSREEGVSSKLNTGSIEIGDNCWIASDVVILKGAKIGNNCVIGAGCVIDRNIPDCTIVRLDQAQIMEKIR